MARQAHKATQEKRTIAAPESAREAAEGRRETRGGVVKGAQRAARGALVRGALVQARGARQERRKARAKETQRRRRKPQHEGATKGERTLGPWGEEAEMRRASAKGSARRFKMCKITVGIHTLLTLLLALPSTSQATLKACVTVSMCQGKTL